MIVSFSKFHARPLVVAATGTSAAYALHNARGRPASWISPATVSRVLNNMQYTSGETRARVLNAVRGFNYFKNVHARRLATGRSDLFGFVVSEIANPSPTGSN